MPAITSQSWALAIPPAARTELARFRTTPGLLGCETPDALWITPDRKSSVPPELVEQLHFATAAQVFHITTDKSLIPHGRTVPVGTLPAGPWSPLVDLFQLSLPVAGFAGPAPSPITIILVRDDASLPPALLETDLSSWVAYVRTAPNVRLNRCEFAVSLSRRVLVRGLPLPPLPGTRYWESSGLIIPAGYRLSPDLQPSLVRRILLLEEGEHALWSEPTATWERLPPEAFIPARRANVLQTLHSLALNDHASST